MDTVMYTYCRIHLEAWVRATIGSGMTCGMSERECPECVRERSKKALTSAPAVDSAVLAADDARPNTPRG